jgi:integrase
MVTFAKWTSDMPPQGVTMSLLEVLSDPAFRAQREPATLYKYAQCIARLSEFGLHWIKDVGVRPVAAFVEARIAVVSPQTVQGDLIALFAVMRHLERTGRIEAGTLRAIRPLCPKNRKTQLLNAEWLTREQVSQLAASKCRKDSIAVFTLWVAVLSGLRAAELGRLTWADVDIQRRVLAVRGRTKTRRERLVPICEELRDLLISHPFALRTKAAGAAVLSIGRAVVTRRTLLKRISVLSERSGVTATLVLCRHTRASWWVQAGVPIAKVAQWLGHSPDVCQKSYAGLIRGFDPDADLVA